jgi:hypothetical protein
VGVPTLRPVALGGRHTLRPTERVRSRHAPAEPPDRRRVWVEAGVPLVRGETCPGTIGDGSNMPALIATERTPVRRRRPILRVVAVLAIAAVAWVGLAAHVRGQVRVTLGAAPIDCDDTPVGTTSVPGQLDGPAVEVPAVRFAPGVTCVLEVDIQNHGRWPVRVDHVGIPTLADERGPFRVHGLVPEEGPTTDERGAGVMRSGPLTLPARSAQRVRLRIERADDGSCTNVLHRISDAPVVRVRAFGLAGDAHPHGRVLALLPERC